MNGFQWMRRMDGRGPDVCWKHRTNQRSTYSFRRKTVVRPTTQIATKQAENEKETETFARTKGATVSTADLSPVENENKKKEEEIITNSNVRRLLFFALTSLLLTIKKIYDSIGAAKCVRNYDSRTTAGSILPNCYYLRMSALKKYYFSVSSAPASRWKYKNNVWVCLVGAFDLWTDGLVLPTTQVKSTEQEGSQCLAI